MSTGNVARGNVNEARLEREKCGFVPAASGFEVPSQTFLARTREAYHLDGPGGQMPLVSVGAFERNAVPVDALELITREIVPEGGQ